MLVLLIIFLITIPVIMHDGEGRSAEGRATFRRRPSQKTSRWRSTPEGKIYWKDKLMPRIATSCWS